MKKILVTTDFSAGSETSLRLVYATKPSMLIMFKEHHKNLFEKIFLSSKSAENSYHPTVMLLVFSKV